MGWECIACYTAVGHIIHLMTWVTRQSKEACQWGQVINHGIGRVIMGGMEMMTLLDEYVMWLWPHHWQKGRGRKKRKRMGATGIYEAMEPYLIELRKIFVRKLLATCTSFSEGIFWATISTIFIFLGSRGRNTQTKNSRKKQVPQVIKGEETKHHQVFGLQGQMSACAHSLCHKCSV